jgi:hypothetical protein
MSLVYTKAAWSQEKQRRKILNYSLSYPLYKNVKYSKAAGDSIFGEVESRALLRLSFAYKPRPRDNQQSCIKGLDNIVSDIDNQVSLLPIMVLNKTAGDPT